MLIDVTVRYKCNINLHIKTDVEPNSLQVVFILVCEDESRKYNPLNKFLNSLKSYLILINTMRPRETAS
jgi:hypothetical protein